jgi:hypothetical protein
MREMAISIIAQGRRGKPLEAANRSLQGLML